MLPECNGHSWPLHADPEQDIIPRVDQLQQMFNLKLILPCSYPLCPCSCSPVSQSSWCAQGTQLDIEYQPTLLVNKN